MAVGKLCHFLAAIHFIFGCYYDWNYVNIPKDVNDNGQYPILSGKLKFLTFWNAVLQAFFFTICLINDFVGTNENIPKKTPWIRKFRDTLMTSFALPLSYFVGLTFWGIYAVDRELILPKVLDPIFPSWLNHLMHTNIVLFITAQLVSSFHSYPSRKLGIGLLLTLQITYLIWIHVIYFYTGSWVYPILKVLNLQLRIVFFLSLLALVVILYLVGENLNKLIWKAEIGKLNKLKRK